MTTSTWTRYRGALLLLLALLASVVEHDRALLPEPPFKALVFVVGAMLLLSAPLLLLPHAHGDTALQQMRAITNLMYVAAAFLLLWISAATAIDRLAALWLVPHAREPASRLVPTISLMGGLFLCLLLAGADLSAGRRRRRRWARPGCLA